MAIAPTASFGIQGSAEGRLLYQGRVGGELLTVAQYLESDLSVGFSAGKKKGAE